VADERFRLFDYHTQTIEHGLAKPRRVNETVQAAIEAGLSSICLTDHFPLPLGYEDPTDEKDCAMAFSDYPKYQQEVDNATRKYGAYINILRGAEFDWISGYELWTHEQVNAWPFDYVIGSVHLLGQIEDERGKRNLILDYKQEEFQRGIDYFGGIRPLGETYYQEVRAMVESGLFDGVGHLDLIKKFNDGTIFSENQSWYQEAVLATLATIAESGMSIEINTAGWDKKCQDAYPSLWILREARLRGIPLTTGSDAHVPENIGRNLDRAIELAKSAGFNHLVEYRRHRQIAVPLNKSDYHYAFEED